MEMDLEKRTKQLISLFSYSNRVNLQESSIDIIPFTFQQKKGIYDIIQLQNNIPVTEFCPLKDSMIEENRDFPYVVFAPEKCKKSSKAILLLHGLNERNWNKYLVWAEEISYRTQRPVILFPIAFHMNRTPATWASPRWVMPFSTIRKQQVAAAQFLTSFNYVLSQRLALSPLRFYISGRESIFNIWQLVSDIKEGNSDLFKKNCDVDIFAYSIGTFLAQVLLMSNPDNLFDKSKLFAFCGGSIFEEMNGAAKDIMDADANDRIHKYFLNRPLDLANDKIEASFNQMVAEDRMKYDREKFYSDAIDRIRFVTLKKDKVIPTLGVKKAVGDTLFSRISEELDFPYMYSHQIPFPIDKGIDNKLLINSLDTILSKACAFLA